MDCQADTFFLELSGQGAQLTTIESLVQKRAEARRQKDFQLADRILKHLLDQSIRLLDQADGSSVVINSLSSSPSSGALSASSSSSSSSSSSFSSSAADSASTKGLSGRRRAAKHSALRQKQSRHRFAIFASFIDDTFRSIFAEQPSNLRVLDVAGGSGELSWRLARKGFVATVVDPRPLTFTRIATEKILCHRAEPSDGTAAPPSIDYSGVDEKKQQRQQEMTSWLHAKTLRSFANESQTKECLDRFLALSLFSVVSEFSVEWKSSPLVHDAQVIVGLHPDQATEAIVDVALATEKPFAVVPCCVFPSLFPDRQLEGTPVSSYEQFLDYLQAKNPAIQRREVDGLGQRKVVLFAVPPFH